MYILYNILILIVLVIFIVPYYTYRLFTEKGFALRFKQSLGCVDEEDIAKVAGKDCVWIHGASVGEIVATSPLVKQNPPDLIDQNNRQARYQCLRIYDRHRVPEQSQQPRQQQIVPQVENLVDVHLDRKICQQSLCIV